MDMEEQEIQCVGYVDVIILQEVFNVIQVGLIGKVVVIYMEWGGVDEYFIVVDWIVINDVGLVVYFVLKIVEVLLCQVQRMLIVLVF